MHHFPRSERGRSEVLLEIADDSGLLRLRNILAPAATLASCLLLSARLQSLQQLLTCSRLSASRLQCLPLGLDSQALKRAILMHIQHPESLW